MDDRNILYLAALLRALALGMIGILLAIYLSKIEFSPSVIGVIISLGLLGGAMAALLITFLGDYLGRKRSLLCLALLSAAGGFVIVFVSDVFIVAIASFVGVLNGMGRDRGAALILEQAILPVTTTDADRTSAFAWYNMLQDIGLAVGALLATIPSLLSRIGFEELISFRVAIFVYASLMLLTAFLYIKLSPKVEVVVTQLRPQISARSQKILLKLSVLFAIDSVSGGFLAEAMLSLFFYVRFNVSVIIIALLFFGGRILNACSYFGAAWLAKRFGLVNTMVFTHIPSSLILIIIAITPGSDFWIAAVLFLLREALVEMDVPARESYVMAVIRPEERTFASGVTHLVRLGGWAVAPAFAGVLMQFLAVSTPLLIGAAMKISYDVLLYFSFRKIKPPEEIEIQH
ncbi:MFS transporter [Fluoribacter dumoffii]|uniref:H+ Antiporter protein n=1 Tax=Fluoribacter dumoffii TaxID=463 RepID=A0A377ITU5_9GAMM|nr:MFS transporter [Fluoribacter dumoffii]KTC89161.1 Major Facilitator Superfamily protein [Fluoribacter dumoffii NY 23]STO91567.1 H+ Antiporter protein [Fluoribacter dumoffii]